MSSPRRPSPAGGRSTARGPLPPSVYWRRRVFVLGVAFALVFIIARWLTAGSDGSSGDADTAEQAGNGVAATETVTAGQDGDKKGGSGKGADEPTGGASGGASGGTPTGPTTPTTPTLAPPQGNCSASDVLVTPSVAAGAVAGRDVALQLSLQTRTAEACTWEIGPKSLTVRIGQGRAGVWSTQQCPRAVPRQSVVVRRQVATIVQLTWAETRKSTEGCTAGAGWAMPGDFTIAAAALGGEPTEAEFSLGKPVAATVHVTPSDDATSTKAKKKPKKSKTPVN
ncbi:hypothetical protein [Pimelobacter simplex]|uniref:hypothetical protein n=1 Tax=Nocardioides simplex TaxID=2045 RepID=UPI00214F7463|nr:hypothetical protein [Pimelobacter simplex]UUW91669.1 hypothetical protein M0M43_09325 [Pimelobacter simplex]UUW95497.1 hypothetical protein M0M48_27825 [Pimelobacter simplex]